MWHARTLKYYSLQTPFLLLSSHSSLPRPFPLDGYNDPYILNYKQKQIRKKYSHVKLLFKIKDLCHSLYLKRQCGHRENILITFKFLFVIHDHFPLLVKRSLEKEESPVNIFQ